MVTDYNELIAALEEKSERGDGILFAVAADAIEELQAQMPRWISVEERLPEVGEKVLCLCRAQIVDVLMWYGDCWVSTGAEWVKTGNAQNYMSSFVTHWMHLPAPPEEVGE